MKLVTTSIPGVVLIEPEPLRDERGFFARIWDRDELISGGLDPSVAQVSLAFNDVKGTLRGLHYQAEPHGEAKNVRCTSGAIWDVAVDLRIGSSTRYSWVAFELSATNRRTLHVPRGCAHGYITLTDSAEVLYQISSPHRPDAGMGCLWDDPVLAITWPLAPARISERDLSYARLALK